MAGNKPHTVLGGKISTEDGVLYRQSAIFRGEPTWPSANGKNILFSRVDWHTHGRPNIHPNPHEHLFQWNQNQKSWEQVPGNTPFYNK
jgi:hypothetical protein